MTAPHLLDVGDRVASPTEQRLPASTGIDTMTSREILELINDEDARVPDVVRAHLDPLARLVDQAVVSLGQGGRIHYFGAGTSGRLGTLDAAEVPPTYGLPADLFVAHMAGGAQAMTLAVEGAEDDADAGAREATATVRPGDIVFGLAASGRTPYVAGALSAAQHAGAHTVAVTSNPGASIARWAHTHLCLATGAEVVTGSTRMKAGTAQKLVLHSFSTALMVRIGRTYSNLMVDVVPFNDKLRRRVVRLLVAASGADDDRASEMLAATGGDTKTALVALVAETDPDVARGALADTGGDVRTTVERLRARDRDERPGTTWLGVDIGASGFRIAVTGHDGVLAERHGTVRPRVTDRGLDVTAVVHALASDLESLRSDGLSIDLDAVVVGVAGGRYFDLDLQRIADDVRGATGAREVACTSDAVTSYVGAVGAAAGAVLAAGTGAVAMASDGADVWRQVDGLGHLLGDHGGGAWIGRRALSAAVAPAAGRDPRSARLVEALHARFADPAGLVTRLYRSQERAALLASFVPAVIEAADAGDAFCRQVLRDAAEALATTLLAAADGTAGPLVAVGGLVTAGSPLRDLLEERLNACGTTLTPPRGTAARGAATLAQTLHTGALPRGIHEQISATSSTKR